MKNISLLVTALSVLAALTGCATAPTSIVQKPLTARPAPTASTQPGNGAIFQTASYRPLFEDRRARFVGDTLVMTISEKTSAAKTAANSGSKTNSSAASVTSLFGLPTSTLDKFGAGGSSSSKFEGKGAESASNTFTGTLGVTVIEVLPNGYLVVSGEKQVAFDKGTEFIRISGVVNPDQIGIGNTISSTQVADARVEYRTNTHLDMAEIMGMAARFFLSVLPL